METKQPTAEQIQKFWEWCGFKGITNTEMWPNIGTNRPNDIAAWARPNGFRDYILPNLDLNNLFKFAVPKLLNQRYDLCSYLPGEHTARVWSNTYDHSEAKSPDPALALFWAIWGM